MVKLKVVESKKFNEYVLEDLQNCRYSLALNFYDMPRAQKDDVLILPRKWLDKKSPNYVHMLSFEPFEDEDIDFSKEKNIACLKTKEIQYIMKRISG